MLQAGLIKTTLTLALAAATAALLAACGGGTQASPAPSPTWSCTPDASGEPCTPERAAAQQEEAEAYAEAEHVYREFTKERNRLAMQGGTPTPTPEMSRLATGPYLETVSEFLATGHQEGFRSSAALQVTAVEPVTYADGKVVLRACEDGRQIQVISADGSVVGSGGRGTVQLTVEESSAGWQLTEGMNSEVSICE